MTVPGVQGLSSPLQGTFLSSCCVIIVASLAKKRLEHVSSTLALISRLALAVVLCVWLSVGHAAASAGSPAISTDASVLLHTLPRLQLRTCFKASAVHMSRSTHVSQQIYQLDDSRFKVWPHFDGQPRFLPHNTLGVLLAVHYTIIAMRHANRLHLRARSTAANCAAVSRPQWGAQKRL